MFWLLLLGLLSLLLPPPSLPLPFSPFSSFSFLSNPSLFYIFPSVSHGIENFLSLSLPPNFLFFSIYLHFGFSIFFESHIIPEILNLSSSSRKISVACPFLHCSKLRINKKKEEEEDEERKEKAEEEEQEWKTRSFFRLLSFCACLQKNNLMCFMNNNYLLSAIWTILSSPNRLFIETQSSYHEHRFPTGGPRTFGGQ